MLQLAKKTELEHV